MGKETEIIGNPQLEPFIQAIIAASSLQEVFFNLIEISRQLKNLSLSVEIQQLIINLLENEMNNQAVFNKLVSLYHIISPDTL